MYCHLRCRARLHRFSFHTICSTHDAILLSCTPRIGCCTGRAGSSCRWHLQAKNDCPHQATGNVDGGNIQYGFITYGTYHHTLLEITNFLCVTSSGCSTLAMVTVVTGRWFMSDNDPATQIPQGAVLITVAPVDTSAEKP